ncbi:hypothetical protein M011DRAFT_399603 [Sporormia fimetaria CBS 119925]|uniref:Uncharacterized protein n=1 Tax=Sporormia fimetaria CBS 119925 TaxID=1340428 RepID=A0A6A6VFU2_9PLEO|nr:hypothetical protein M011DRAFT_399603 [Sporormia fimetaria CBS 119925]
MSSLLSTISAKAKAHHASVNAAYATYYSPTGSPSTTPAVSTTTSPRPSMDASSRSSSSSSRASDAWKAVKKAAREHHDSVNAAYGAVYSAGTSRAGSVRPTPAGSPRISMEQERELAKLHRGTGKSAWEKVKTRAKDHHRSVNAAYAVHYGGSGRL